MSKRVQIITGHYGSGKTEFAVNLALRYADEGAKTALADLDIVNPYFRSTERRALLEAHGIRLITTSFSGYVDLPAITPEVLAIFDSPEYHGVIDVGGDPEGAHVLGRFETQLARTDFDLFCVINANRPETGNAEKAISYLRCIENACGQKITALVNNTHLCRETRAEDILKGARVCAEVAKETHIPIAYHAVEQKFVSLVKGALGEGELMPIQIYMCKPWEV